MRSHLIQCLSNSKMEQFRSEMVHALPMVKKEKIKLYCTCRMPDLEGQENMAYCPKCHECTMAAVNKYLLLYFPINGQNIYALDVVINFLSVTFIIHYPLLIVS